MDTFSQLRASLIGRGHPSNPFLDAAYSPGSRMPSADFSGWIAERLRQKDYEGIRTLLAEIAGNTRTADALVRTAVGLPLEQRFVASPEAYDEFRAIEMLVHRIGDGKYHWRLYFVLTNAFMVHPVTIHPENLDETLKAVNKQIRKDNKDGIRQRQLCTPDMLPKNSDWPEQNPLLRALRQTPVGIRLHLFETLWTFSQQSRQSVSLMSTTTYTTREFGLDIAFSADALYQSGIFSPVTDPIEIACGLYKDDVIEIAQRAGIAFKPTQTRKKIAELLSQSTIGVSLLQQAASVKKVVRQNDACKEAIWELRTFQAKCEYLSLALANC